MELTQALGWGFPVRAFCVGGPLSCWATCSRSSGPNTLRSVPLGKYCRSRPLVFSVVPRRQGLRGWKGYTTNLTGESAEF